MIAAFAALALMASPDGRRLSAATTCYAITAPSSGGDRVIGATWQAVTKDRIGGRPVWRVVVHQRLTSGRSFDMRDAFVLDAATLRPLSLETTFDGKPHARLAYASDRVTGEHWDRAGERHAIDQPLTGPVWDGDLYGLTFAALPLTLGASFRLPFYQYDKGLGAFTLAVKGSEQVATPSGEVDAWVVDAGPSPDERSDYLIGKADHRELGYRSPQGGQRLGGDCTGLR